MILASSLRVVLLSAVAAGVSAGLLAASASATPRKTTSTDVVVDQSANGHVHHRHHRHHHRHHAHRVVVDAPYTRVSRRSVTVAAPFADVRVRRGRSIHVAAPFVDVRIAR